MWVAFRRDVADYARKRGLEIDLREDGTSVLTAHYLRHNFASMLYYAGVDLLRAKEWMGHADIQTMLRIYTHLQALGEQPYDRSFDFFKKLTYG